MIQVLQRDWTAEPRELGAWFILTKGSNRRTAKCELWTHLFGWELRLFANGQMVKTQVCRTQDEVMSTGDAWKVAMLEKGWNRD